MTGAAAIHHEPAAPRPVVATAKARAAGASFERHLGAAAPDARLVAAREAAKQTVASTLVLPILQSLRDSSMLTGPFAPGIGERRFLPLLDQHLADRITSAAHFPLVDAVTEQLIGRSEASAPASQPNEKGAIDVET